MTEPIVLTPIGVARGGRSRIAFEASGICSAEHSD